MSRSQKVIKQAKERDNNNCQKCGYNGGDKSRIKGHHIIPLAFDGPDEVDNVATLCNHCHRYAPEDFLTREWYEPVFKDYVETGVRPEVDFAYFGSRIMAHHAGSIAKEIESEDDWMEVPDKLRQAFQLAFEIQRDLPEEREFTDAGYYWLLLSEAASHGCIPDAEKLTDEHIEDYL